MKQIELRHRRDNLAAVEIDIRKFERATPLQSELRYIEQTIADETLRRALVGIIIVLMVVLKPF